MRRGDNRRKELSASVSTKSFSPKWVFSAKVVFVQVAVGPPSGSNVKGPTDRYDMRPTDKDLPSSLLSSYVECEARYFVSFWARSFGGRSFSQ